MAQPPNYLYPSSKQCKNGSHWRRGGYLEPRTFIVKTDGTVWATGDNPNGILGDGTDISRTSFVPINVK